MHQKDELNSKLIETEHEQKQVLILVCTAVLLILGMAYFCFVQEKNQKIQLSQQIVQIQTQNDQQIKQMKREMDQQQMSNIIMQEDKEKEINSLQERLKLSANTNKAQYTLIDCKNDVKMIRTIGCKNKTI